MILKNLFRISLIAAAVSLTACDDDTNSNTGTTVTDGGGDTNSNTDTTVTDGDGDGDGDTNSNTDTTVTDGDGDGDNNTGGSTECASYTNSSNEVVGGDFNSNTNICSYDQNFSSAANPVTADITLDGDYVHYFTRSLVMGVDCDTTSGCTIEPNGPTLTVEAGAKVVFDGASSRVQINRGANIDAQGSLAEPIEFTSANTIDSLQVKSVSPQDWGGIIINGFGITDQCEDAQRIAGTCNAKSEGAVSNYGGNDNTDNSGTLTYVKIHFAGGLPAGAEEGDDLNSLSLNAVGDQTTIEYIDIYAGYDDGIELFGGAVDLKYVVITDTQDDSIDIDAGWRGNLQYSLIKHGTVLNAAGQTIAMGNGGFEADGVKGTSSTEAPASAPNLANITIITTDALSVRDGAPSIAIKLDDNIEAKWYNTVVLKQSGTQTWCIDVEVPGAEDTFIDGDTSFNSSITACDTLAQSGNETITSGAISKTVATWATEDGVSQAVTGTEEVLATNGFSTAATVTITPTVMTTVDADFFEATSFIGALDESDTTSNWYQWAQQAFTNADDE